ncbi:MAG: pantoate--beta-alanine ligase [Planctomycetota bacterium]
MSSAGELPELVSTRDAIRDRVVAARREGRRVGLVPTMGALHAGHLSLVERARAECGLVLASVFVNPTQFGPGEDLERYPRDLDADLRLLAGAGCGVVFAPSVETMYPPGCDTWVEVGAAAKPLEGEHRPTHFRGVATVVLKLMNLAPADAVYFGRKDYQQTVVVRRMVEDLNVPIEVVVCPTVREPDGLAMSSRNAYLSSEERQRALALSRGLRAASEMHAAGERRAPVIRGSIEQLLAEAGVETQYVALLREGTVDAIETIDGPTVVAIAGKVGETRLIDNATIG